MKNNGVSPDELKNALMKLSFNEPQSFFIKL